MKRLEKKVSIVFVLIMVSIAVLNGCSQSDHSNSQQSSNVTDNLEDDANKENANSESNSNTDNKEEESANNDGTTATELEVCFGYEGEPYVLHLYDNETAAEIARDVGTTDWNLPIIHFDDYENYEVMQYYDIPSSYEIPSNPETVTEEKAGEVYYSDPNRIILFYHDANVTGEYTKVGYIDNSDEFVEAVENNPVLEGWGTKIISVTRKD